MQKRLPSIHPTCAYIKAISVMSSCPASTICRNRQGNHWSSFCF